VLPALMQRQGARRPSRQALGQARSRSLPEEGSDPRRIPDRPVHSQRGSSGDRNWGRRRFRCARA